MALFGKNCTGCGVISPAGAIAPEKLDSGIAALKEIFPVVKVGAHAHGKLDYLSATAQERFADLKKFWLDDEIDLILASRGGFGCAHLLKQISTLPHREKLIGGYSDLTALLWALEKSGNGTPVVMPMAGKFAGLDKKSLDSAVAAVKRLPRIMGEGLTVLKQGKITGLPLAGNLTVAATLAGTNYFPDCRGRILILEDVNEPLYRIDRELTQLEQCGALTNCAGVIFGAFTGAEFAPSQLEKLLRRFAEVVNGPVLSGLAFGHEFPLESINFHQEIAIDGEMVRAL